MRRSLILFAAIIATWMFLPLPMLSGGATLAHSGDYSRDTCVCAVVCYSGDACNVHGPCPCKCTCVCGVAICVCGDGAGL